MGIVVLASICVWLFVCMVMYLSECLSSGRFKKAAYALFLGWPILAIVGFAITVILIVPFFVVVAYYKWKERKELESVESSQ